MRVITSASSLNTFLARSMYLLTLPPPVLARVACKVLLHDGVLAFGMVSWVRCDQFPIHVDFYELV